MELIEKSKLVKAETVKSEEEARTQLDSSLRLINEHRKEFDNLKAELRKTTNQVRDAEDEENELRRMLDAREI